jgi:hypothetical protein
MIARRCKRGCPVHRVAVGDGVVTDRTAYGLVVFDKQYAHANGFGLGERTSSLIRLNRRSVEPPVFFACFQVAVSFGCQGTAGKLFNGTALKSLVISGLIVNLATVAAYAGERCDVPVADWQPREALRSKLEAGGWHIRAIKAADGCYEAFGVDEKGKAFEAYFNPRTLKPINKTSDGSHG